MRYLTLLLLPALLAGCVTAQTHTTQNKGPTLDELRVEVHQSIEKVLFIGMSTDRLHQELGIDPDIINATVTTNGRSEQWVYNIVSLYVYVVDGKVTAWQLSKFN